MPIKRQMQNVNVSDVKDSRHPHFHSPLAGIIGTDSM